MTRLRTAVLVLLTFPALAGVAVSCPVCYGETGGQMVDAAQWGTWLLLGVTVLVQGAFAAFFFYLRRQAQRAQSDAIDQEWSELQRQWADNYRSMNQ